ncbi:MAG TPA: serine/threonine-protein kinase, partial [Thermoanaerobaculia bacterium]|nr:serine/threonine-protein kinase [Thermoanaerobaculia bacterium]
EERLGLFRQVCLAVAHAHRQHVVHRDLKPANILVGKDGVPKLLDFGIAKLLDPATDPQPGPPTRAEARRLTPEYASPEQLSGTAIGYASDIYALGVVLYELLTGELPHQRAVTSAAVARRAAGSGRRGERASAQPRAEQLRGDLDAVVLRALAREPARRYPSAAALGDDLRRHLEGRPVAARPDSFGYVASRFVRRHRLAVGATALVALSLVGGFGAALVSAERARREAARAEAESARARAEGERAKRMKDFLISVFQEASPMQRARGTPLSIEELLDAAEGRIDAELAAEPLLQADLWDDLAETRASGGNLEAASQLIDKALAAKRAHLAPDDLSLVESLVNRGAIWNLLSTAVRRSLAAGRVGSEDERAALEAELERRAELGLAALDEAQAILERRGEGDSEPAVNVAVNRVHALLVLDRDEEGAAASERAAELTDRWRSGSPDAAMQHHNSGLVAVRQGRNEDAKRHFLAAIERLEKLLGPDHALVSLPVLGLADLYENRLGDVAGAIPYYERALAIVERHYPEGNPERVERETDLHEARAKLGR